MTGSEKKLVAVLGGVVGVYFGYVTLNSLYITPRRELIDKVSFEEQRFNNLLAELGKISTTNADWGKQTRRTLSAKRDEAHMTFREQIAALLKKHQLLAGHSLGQIQPREVKKDSKKGFVELPLSVSTDGTLPKLSAFLEDVQKLPYYVSVDKVVLNASAADQGLAGSGGGKDKKGIRPGASKDGPTLRVQMTLTTLVLPKVGDADHRVFDPKNENAEPALKPRNEDVSYATVAAHNVFRPYAAPEQIVQREPLKEGDKPPPPPPPPLAKRDARVLVGTPSLNGEPVAFVRDPDKKTVPPEELRLNAAVSDDGRGKLVLVHPKGIVIRVTQPNDPAAKNYFVALGEKLSERQELTAQAHPDVFAMLSRVVMQ